MIYLASMYLFSISATPLGIFLVGWMSIFPDVVDYLVDQHRCWGHSILWLIPLAVMIFLNFNLGLALMIGFISHLILDGFTTYGCPLFYPLHSFDFTFLVVETGYRPVPLRKNQCSSS